MFQRICYLSNLDPPSQSTLMVLSMRSAIALVLGILISSSDKLQRYLERKHISKDFKRSNHNLILAGLQKCRFRENISDKSKKFTRLTGCEMKSMTLTFKTEMLIYQSNLHEKNLFD